MTTRIEILKRRQRLTFLLDRHSQGVTVWEASVYLRQPIPAVYADVRALLKEGRMRKIGKYLLPNGKDNATVLE